MIFILIVDDKPENLYLLHSMLDINGFKTIPAKNGAEALGLMRNNIPDLIIADILMPVMDGFTLCRECKKDETLKSIPFFFYTATYIDPKDEEYALSLGADRFILKPQEPEVFIKIISDFLVEVKEKNIQPKKITPQTEVVVLKEYNEVLIRKIEDKMLQTEKSEKELRKYSEELLKAKERAEESDRLKTAFLHNISHEVRTPMNAIVGFSDLISDPDLSTELRNEFAQTIVRSSNQLLSIITQIINMATIEAGLEKIYEKQTSLNSIFKIISDQYSSEAILKNITLEYSTGLPEHEDLISTDETKLIQIISNLISNALKFTKDGSISFGYIVNNKFIEFYVKDTGIGIPEEMHEEIFKRFRQVETTLAREFDGAGLGLSISQAYVELLGGRIWLTSRYGEGSVFYFSIPYNKISVQKITNGNSGNKIVELKKPVTLLVVEDEINNFTLLTFYLSDSNINLLHAENGIEAVEICKNNNQIDLVLMDLKMPVMDGFEATKRIMEFRPELPVIAQTAYVRDVDKTRAFASGCSGFISKPFKKEELLALIRNHLVFD